MESSTPRTTPDPAADSSTAALLQRAVAGDQSVLTRLLERYRHRLWRMIETCPVSSKWHCLRENYVFLAYPAASYSFSFPILRRS